MMRAAMSTSLPVARNSPIASRVETFGSVMLIWSILMGVAAVLFGLNSVVGAMLQPRIVMDAAAGPAGRQFAMTQQWSQWAGFAMTGLALLWCLGLALAGLRIGPALGRIDSVRRWAIIWCVGNIIVCPFGTGIALWGLALLLRADAAELLESGAPAGIE
jgi:hypothetical protein